MQLTSSRSFALLPFSTRVSCHFDNRGSPAARIVSFSTVIGAIFANSATLSWGKNELSEYVSKMLCHARPMYHRLFAWMPISATVSRTVLFVVDKPTFQISHTLLHRMIDALDSPFINHSDLSSSRVNLLLITTFAFPFLALSSISVSASSEPCLTYDLRSFARPITFDQINTNSSTCRNSGMYLGRETQTNGDTCCNGTFACSIRTQDHVEMRTWSEFDMVISHKVAHLDTGDRTCDKAMQKISAFR